MQEHVKCVCLKCDHEMSVELQVRLFKRKRFVWLFQTRIQLTLELSGTTRHHQHHNSTSNMETQRRMHSFKQNCIHALYASRGRTRLFKQSLTGVYNLVDQVATLSLCDARCTCKSKKYCFMMLLCSNRVESTMRMNAKPMRSQWIWMCMSQWWRRFHQQDQ